VLKQRLITALVLIPLFVGAVLLLPAELFVGLISIITLAAAWEWSQLAGISRPASKTLYLLSFILGMLVLWVFLENPAVQYAVLSITFGWWLYCLAQIVAGRADIHGQGLGGVQPAVMGLLALLPTWFAISVLKNDQTYSNQYVLFLFLLIWVADIAAYAAGRTWGSRKLSSRLSPGKTWEGVFGAVVATLTFAAIGAVYFEYQGYKILLFILLCLVCLVLSITGDLTESILKRQKGVKDSGRILPGHGGVLDRIDSLTASSSSYVLGILLLGHSID